MYTLGALAIAVYAFKFPECILPGKKSNNDNTSTPVYGNNHHWHLTNFAAKNLIHLLYILGRVNYIGASHQCWHVIIVIAFCWWYKASVQFFHFRQEYGCEIDDIDLFNTRTFPLNLVKPSITLVAR